MTARFTTLRLDAAPDLLAGLAADSWPSRERFYWSRPCDALRVLAVGEVACVETSGPDRLGAAGAAARRLLDGLAPARPLDPRPTPDFGPLLVGGFAFSDARPFDSPWSRFPSTRWVLPELLFVARGDDVWLTVCSAADASRPLEDLEAEALALAAGLRAPAPPSAAGAHAAAAGCGFERGGPDGMTLGPEYRVRSDRSHADYLAQVRAARRAIAAGDFEKVVLARSLRVWHDGRFDVPGLLRRLEGLYPTCATFAVGRPDATFLGATPERLVERRGDAVLSGALAGSAPRGRSHEEDERFARELFESKKEQAEHAVVVRSLERALAPVCETLEVPEAPRLLRLEGIQHLETPISGTLRAEARTETLLDLAARIHPTPAVGGAPRDAALGWIERSEGLDRGWYAGGVGLLDANGGGEIRVALRSGLIRSNSALAERAGSEEAFLFAGGGIVADSCPARELDETRTKLRALLAPLTEI